jgi:hypothetical protein
MITNYDFRNTDLPRPASRRPRFNSGKAITVEQARSLFLSESREDQPLITRSEVAALLACALVVLGTFIALTL